MADPVRNRATDAQLGGALPPSACSSPLLLLLAVLGAMLIFDSGAVQAAGIAYGTVNNFDRRNDTNNICHGFEIELDDIPTPMNLRLTAPAPK